MVLGILSGSQMAGFTADKSPVVLKTNTTTDLFYLGLQERRVWLVKVFLNHDNIFDTGQRQLNFQDITETFRTVLKHSEHQANIHDNWESCWFWWFHVRLSL